MSGVLASISARFADKPLLATLHSRLVTMKTPRLLRAWRSARLFLHLLLGLTEVALLFKRRDAASRARAIARWSRRLCQILGIEVEARGDHPELVPTNTVLVANHVSWLDIFVMNAVCPSRFVAKSEVRRWPLIGWLCHRTGTLFVARERRHDTVRVNRQIAHALSSGDCIAVFPEGSTTHGLDVASFNASLLQPAIEAGARLQPIALRYYDQHGLRSTAAAYVGEMSLIESMGLLLAEPRMRVTLDYLPILAAQEYGRRELAQLAQQRIAERVRSDIELVITTSEPVQPANGNNINPSR